MNQCLVSVMKESLKLRLLRRCWIGSHDESLLAAKTTACKYEIHLLELNTFEPFLNLFNLQNWRHLWNGQGRREIESQRKTSYTDKSGNNDKSSSTV
ncbi:hypothetical protein M5K25_027582 [Dendrobium thyrsiflorum]|uniref:Uncharacterized protein n=1 Tax=Dendrobium thyrsiflorum TaxID=117978 RepID=A0ABD0TU79_DENTH